jgi:hypothetical protein
MYYFKDNWCYGESWRVALELKLDICKRYMINSLMYLLFCNSGDSMYLIKNCEIK